MPDTRFIQQATWYEQTYQGEPHWDQGIFHDRVEVRLPKDPERGPHGGAVFHVRRDVEDCPSLDGTRTTVAPFDRWYGTVAEFPSRAINMHMSISLQVIENTAHGVWVVVDDQYQHLVVETPGQTIDIDFDVALTQRLIRLTIVPHLELSAASDATTSAVLRAEGECVVEILSCSFSPCLSTHEKAAASHTANEHMHDTYKERPTIFVCADSLAQTYNWDQRPQTGWGEVLARYLGVESCVISHDERFSYAAVQRYKGISGPCIVNAAMAGRSSRSFLREGKLAHVLAQVHDRDVVLVQFGANDATCARPSRYVAPEEFESVLERYVVSARDRGVIPIIITPPPRHHFDADGSFVQDFGAYVDVERAYCDREHVAIIDLMRGGGNLIAAMGPERSRALYMKLSVGQETNYSDGLDDSTHLSHLGARVFGRLVAQGVAHECPYVPFFDDVPEPIPSTPEHLEARVDEDASHGVRLTWDGDSAAWYYTVERLEVSKDVASSDDACESRDIPVSCTTTTHSWFVDMTPILRPEHVRYIVRAWRDTEASPAACVEIARKVPNDQARTPLITGFNVYEVDAESISDEISFSVRFSSCEGMDSYRIMASNEKTGQCIVLDTLTPDLVDGLHSYHVSRESGWRIYVEAHDSQRVCRSSSSSLPAGIKAPGRMHASWEMPF